MPYEEGVFISSEAIVHIEAAFFKLELNITVQVFMNRATFSPIERASALDREAARSHMGTWPLGAFPASVTLVRRSARRGEVRECQQRLTSFETDRGRVNDPTVFILKKPPI